MYNADRRHRLSLNELALVMELSRHNKVVSKLCGKLREGGLISVYEP